MMKKLFVMFLAAFMFAAPATADDGRFSAETKYIMDFQTIFDTKFWDDVYAYQEFLTGYCGKYFDEKTNGLNISLLDLANTCVSYMADEWMDEHPGTNIEAMDKSVSDDLIRRCVDMAYSAFSIAQNKSVKQLSNENQALAIEQTKDDIYKISKTYNQKNMIFSMFRGTLGGYIVSKYCSGNAGSPYCGETPGISCTLRTDDQAVRDLLNRDLEYYCDDTTWNITDIGNGRYQVSVGADAKTIEKRRADPFWKMSI